MPSQLQRTHPRVKYPVEVRLTSRALDHVLVALSHNLSTSGILVEARESLDVGTRLNCEIPLPGGPRHVSGMVARVQPMPLPPAGYGLGIRFVDLDPEIEEVLRGLVQTEEPTSRLARVHFEGVKDSLRSQAVPTADGIRLATVLPFLRTGCEVSVSFVSGSSRVLSRGIVRDVSFEPRQPDGIPRMAINVQFPRGREPAYLPIDDEGEEVTAVESPHARAKLVTNAAASTAPVRPEVARPEVARPAAAAVAVRPTLDTRALTPARLRRPLGLRGRPRLFGDATERPTARVRHEPLPAGTRRAVRIGVFATAGVALLVAAALLTRGSWGGRTANAPAPRAGKATPAPVRRAPPAAPVAAALPISPTAAPQPQPTAHLQPAAETPPAPLTLPALLDAVPPKFAHDPVTGLPPLPSATPGPKITFQPATEPGVTPARRAELQAEVPFRGSSFGAIHYALAQPRGVAVTLPHARSLLPLGRHVVANEGFRYVWIRELEEGGIQVRFMFAERTPLLRALEVDEGLVRVRVAPPAPESK